MTGPAFTNTMIDAAAIDNQADWIFQDILRNSSTFDEDTMDFAWSFRNYEAVIGGPLGYFVH